MNTKENLKSAMDVELRRSAQVSGKLEVIMWSIMVEPWYHRGGMQGMGREYMEREQGKCVQAAVVVDNDVRFPFAEL